MKKTFILLIAFALVALQFGCLSRNVKTSNTNSDKTSDTDNDTVIIPDPSENGNMMEVGSLANKLKENNPYNKPFDDLREYSYDSFMLQVFKKPSSCMKILTTMSNKLLTLDSFNDVFPIEKMSVVNENCISVEYKLNKNGRIYHIYAVFERSVKTSSDGDYELWQNFGEIYFAYPDLTSDDVRAVYDVGKDISADELPICIDLNNTVYFSQEDDGAAYHSEETVLLKDGILIIGYDAEKPNSTVVTVTGDDFIPYGDISEKYPENSLVKYSFTVG